MLTPTRWLMTLAILAVAVFPHDTVRVDATGAREPVRIGAVFPLRTIGALAREEYLGVRIAHDFVNANTGVEGRPITLVTRELDTPAQSQSRKLSGGV